MTVPFLKMHGAGNDFILIDNRAAKIRLTPSQVVRLCDRHLGIGADGVLLLVPARGGEADWAWEFYNSDGSVAEMCGNGARCFARFVQRLTQAPADVAFETGAGIIRAHFEGERVTVSLTPARGLRLEQSVPTTQGPVTVHSIDTGVPHAVVVVPDAEQAMVQELGAELRHHPAFAPRGTNVNFVQVLGPGRIRVRTYERGVEGETLACGTGVTAAALIAARLHGFESPVHVQVQGGEILAVSFRSEGEGFAEVRLSGPATFVFSGSIDL